ncbi:MAG: type II secretion system protein N [Mariprofundales bacterium]|nr:type II secretion system protein N [Mariprofundales bacterium]
MIESLQQPQWWLQRLPGVLELLLLLLLAWLTSGLLLPQRGGGDDAAVVSSPVANGDQRQTVDIQDIIDHHLFGRPVVVVKPTPKPAPPPPPPPVVKRVAVKLNAKLVGTVVAGEHSVAMIMPMPGRAVDLYYVGDVIIPRVTLRQVFVDHVLLDADGDVRELWLDKRAQAAANHTPAPPPVVQQLASSDPNRRNMGLSRQVVNSAMANFSTLLSQARILPHFTNGRADGFLVTDIAAGSLYQSLGLQNGDILSGVNGKPITSMEQAMNMYRQLQKAPSVDVKVMRGGKVLVFHYNIH